MRQGEGLHWFWLQTPPLPLPNRGVVHESFPFPGPGSAHNKIRKKATCLSDKVRLREIMDMKLAGAQRAALTLLSFLMLVSGAALTEWLKTADIYSLTVLEARSPKWKCCQGHAPSEDSRKIPSASLPASGGGQPSVAFLGL